MTNDNSSEFFTPPVLSISESYSDITPIFGSTRGFAQLYRASKDGKLFILKGLKAEYQGVALYEELLRKEYELGYMLDHQYIRKSYGFTTLDGMGSIIIMEYISGRTLREYITSEKHTLVERRTIVKQMCEAVDFAHKQQIVHRDLKPENIIITHNGDNVKVIDFGLSDSDSYISLKEPAGSMRYAAPEVLQGRAFDNRADIYSIGVIISELFHDTRACHDIVGRCTMFEPQMRYASVMAVAEAMRPSRRSYVYPLIIFVLVIVAYLAYTTSQMMSRQEYAQVLIPSAVVDEVSDEEFARRQVLSSHFYEVINGRYLELMNEMYALNCTAEELPNLDTLSSDFQVEYLALLDSMFVGIETSSLYVNARRNLSSHNLEMFTIMRNSYRATFWLNNERLFKASQDSLARALRQLHTPPKIASDYSQLTFDKQQIERRRYEQLLTEYKIATTQQWAILYRKGRGLSPMPTYLYDYYRDELSDLGSL